MKRFGCLLVSFCLVLGILLIAVAEVNHGHGPGYVAEDGHGDSHGSSDEGHGDSAGNHDESVEGHGESEGDHDDHGEPEDSHGAPADGHATTTEQVH